MIRVPLTQGKFALVDDADAWVLEFNWCAHQRWNGVWDAMRKLPNYGKGQFLHQAIMGMKNIDHIDGDALNCQRYNMRVCTQRQNSYNARKTLSPRLSEYKGVTFDRARNRWKAQIVKPNMPSGTHGCLFLGRFFTEYQAALAYDEAARKFFGEFAAVNFPKQGEQSCLRTVQL